MVEIRGKGKLKRRKRRIRRKRRKRNMKKKKINMQQNKKVEKFIGSMLRENSSNGRIISMNRRINSTSNRTI